tara:strand:+ start:421 stop:849 length:429 start_codon:yes stop_codon:yes gene_type:complete
MDFRRIQNSGFYSKSDLKFIHLLSMRGLSFEESFRLILKEKALTRVNNNLNEILKIVSVVSRIGKKEILSSKKYDVVRIRQILCYLCREKTDISQDKIGKFIGIHGTTVRLSCDQIKKDIEVGEPKTIKLLKQIKEEMHKIK